MFTSGEVVAISREAIFVLQILTTALVGIVGWFIVGTLNRLNRTLDRLDSKTDEHEGRIIRLEERVGTRGPLPQLLPPRRRRK